VKNAFIRERRFKKEVGRFKNGKTKTVFCGVCDCCGEEFKMSELSVDHIMPAGSLRGPEDLESFITRLFCSYQNMQLLCKECHTVKTYADKYSITMTEAKAGINAALMKKLPVVKYNEALTKLGASPEHLKNKTTRDNFLHETFNIHWL